MQKLLVSLMVNFINIKFKRFCIFRKFNVRSSFFKLYILIILNLYIQYLCNFRISAQSKFKHKQVF